MKLWLFVLLISIFNSAFASLPALKAHINNKQYADAIKLGEALKHANPNSASVLFYTALAYQNSQQLELAKSNYLKAISLNNTSPEIYNNLASVYVAEKNYTKAAEALTAAINSQPSIATAYANLSQIYRHLASQAYQQVLKKESRVKKPKTTIKPQLLASVDLNESLLPIIAKPDKPKIIVASVTKKVVPIAQSTVKAPIVKTVLPSAQQAIINWAKAWKAKQYNNYVNSYSNSYAPKNLSHKQWLVQREKRIKRPGVIAVSVSNFDIKLFNTKAYVNFDQAYRSATYQDKVRKRMHLTLINGEWRITSEVTLSVL